MPAHRRKIAWVLFWIGSLLLLGLTVAIGSSSGAETRHWSSFWLCGLFLSLLLAGDALRMPTRWMGWALLILFAGSIFWISHYTTERVDFKLWYFFAWTIVAVIREELKRFRKRQDNPDAEGRS